MTSSVPEATDLTNYIEFLVQLSIFHLVNEDCTEVELSMSQLELSVSVPLSYKGKMHQHHHGNMTEESVIRGIFSIRNIQTVMRIRHLISVCVQRRCITVLKT
jgi:hypothetical protein